MLFLSSSYICHYPYTMQDQYMTSWNKSCMLTIIFNYWNRLFIVLCYPFQMIKNIILDELYRLLRSLFARLLQTVLPPRNFLGDQQCQNTKNPTRLMELEHSKQWQMLFTFRNQSLVREFMLNFCFDKNKIHIKSNSSSLATLHLFVILNVHNVQPV